MLSQLCRHVNTIAHGSFACTDLHRCQHAAIWLLLLPQAINEKPQIIQEYESGKAIPNPQVLSKMSRILGVTLKK